MTLVAAAAGGIPSIAFAAKMAASPLAMPSCPAKARRPARSRPKAAGASAVAEEICNATGSRVGGKLAAELAAAAVAADRRLHGGAPKAASVCRRCPALPPAERAPTAPSWSRDPREPTAPPRPAGRLPWHPARTGGAEAAPARPAPVRVVTSRSISPMLRANLLAAAEEEAALTSNRSTPREQTSARSSPVERTKPVALPSLPSPRHSRSPSPRPGPRTVASPQRSFAAQAVVLDGPREAQGDVLGGPSQEGTPVLWPAADARAASPRTLEPLGPPLKLAKSTLDRNASETTASGHDEAAGGNSAKTSTSHVGPVVEVLEQQRFHAPRLPSGRAPYLKRSRTPAIAAGCDEQLACGAGDGAAAVAVAAVPAPSYKAEMWLRLARIALLELPQLRLPPALKMRLPSPVVDCQNVDEEGHRQAPQEQPPWAAMAYPEASFADATALLGDLRHSDSTDHEASRGSATAERAAQAWTRLVARVMRVTNAAPEITLDEASALSPRFRDGHLCLGEMMEESVTWIDVDTDDDCHSPKNGEQGDAGPCEDAEEGGCEHPALKHIARQQRAPGLVDGMPKCLSF